MDGKYYKCYISWMVNTTSVIYHGLQNPKSVIYFAW